jgi:hypothetical protein
MKRLVLCALGAVSLLGATAAVAGKTQTLTVKITQVTDDEHSAPLNQVVGSMRGARNATDTKEYIGCSSDGVQGRITCFAQDKNGKQVSCIGSTDDVIEAARVATINTSSTIRFTVPSQGRPICLNFTVENSSQNL